MKSIDDVSLAVRLFPKSRLSKTGKEGFWANLLKADFFESIGRLDIDHIVMESHVQYTTEDRMEVLLYKDGDIVISDDKYSVARSQEAGKLVNAVLRAANRASGKTTDYRMSTLLHMNLTSSSSRRFLKDNIRFSPTFRFRKVFGKFKGFRGFILKITDDLEMAASLPGHIDFLKRGVIKGKGKVSFVVPFTATCMRYVDKMSEKT
jgi:hypothetical protein